MWPLAPGLTIRGNTECVPLLQPLLQVGWEHLVNLCPCHTLRSSKTLRSTSLNGKIQRGFEMRCGGINPQARLSAAAFFALGTCFSRKVAELIVMSLMACFESVNVMSPAPCSNPFLWSLVTTAATTHHSSDVDDNFLRNSLGGNRPLCRCGSDTVDHAPAPPDE